VIEKKGNYQNYETRVGIAGNRMLLLSVANVTVDPDNAEAPPLTTDQLTAAAVDVGDDIKP
jgi:hypothetical protein